VGFVHRAFARVANESRDKDRIAALVASGKQIKANRAEYLLFCRGIKPPLLSDRTVVVDPNVDPKRLQVSLDPFGGGAPATRQRP
jgi:hypothetical protein